MTYRLRALLAPHGLVRLSDYRAAFQRAGVHRPLCASLSSKERMHLDRSNLTLFPKGFRAKRIVDVGAAKGEWFSSFSHFQRPAGADLFEPNPAQFAVLRARYGANSAVGLHNVAVGDVAATVPFYITQSPESASLLKPGRGYEELIGGPEPILDCIQVPVVRLDDVLEGRIDLIKLDVQGYERRVLEGAARLLQQTRAVLTEAVFAPQYEGGSHFSTIQEELERAGFHLWDMTPPLRTAIGQRASWADVLFLRAEEYEQALAREQAGG